MNNCEKFDMLPHQGGIAYEMKNVGVQKSQFAKGEAK
jgi:hypothetical protein